MGFCSGTKSRAQLQIQHKQVRIYSQGAVGFSGWEVTERKHHGWGVLAKLAQ